MKKILFGPNIIKSKYVDTNYHLGKHDTPEYLYRFKKQHKTLSEGRTHKLLLAGIFRSATLWGTNLDH